jgi:hypothetical protein
MKIDAAKDSFRRSRIDRRSIRTDGYRRSLEGAVIRRVHLGRTQFSLPPCIHGSDRFKGDVISNLIVGLLDNEDYLLEIGILMEIEREAALIYSNWMQAFHKIEVGYVRLSTCGEEIGFL